MTIVDLNDGERYHLGEMVQFNENHKWNGCFGVIDSVWYTKNDIIYMIGVPVPNNDSEGSASSVAYIFSAKSKHEFETLLVAFADHEPEACYIIPPMLDVSLKERIEREE